MIERTRKTNETDIAVAVSLDKEGKSSIDTGVGFFDHMLETFAKHSRIDMKVTCRGDVHVDDHHSVEDVGIVLGQALHEAIYPVRRIERFGNATVVMDEARVTCDVDLSGRAYLVYDIPVEGKVGSFDVELAEEFFRAFVFNVPMSMHLVCHAGKNKHHIVEAAFKAAAVALRRALQPGGSGVPSTKGTL